MRKAYSVIYPDYSSGGCTSQPRKEGGHLTPWILFFSIIFIKVYLIYTIALISAVQQFLIYF